MPLACSVLTEKGASRDLMFFGAVAVDTQEAGLAHMHIHFRRGVIQGGIQIAVFHGLAAPAEVMAGAAIFPFGIADAFGDY